MATIREGSGTALVVADVRVGFMGDAWSASRVIENVALVVKRAWAYAALERGYDVKPYPRSIKKHSYRQLKQLVH